MSLPLKSTYSSPVDSGFSPPALDPDLAPALSNMAGEQDQDQEQEQEVAGREHLIAGQGQPSG